MGKPYIVLIEDDPDDRRLTVRLLRQAYVDGDIVTMSSGGRALQFLFGTGEFADRDLAHKPELILLDLRLPDMHGLEVLRCLQADARTKDIPVVVLTSSHSEEDLVESYRLGATSYLRKSAAQIGLCCLVGRMSKGRALEQSAAD
ncbi:MAG: response regulator [candidate division KSB1 bacterium]|nr:response regulator [candidate division KSB1 bacterium]MDZ7295269.1 response regulator [candidate division KSB1 bacterium]MDZ7337829.1 response regulator [candidate division KSB1 bacterium]MDZ7378006.1 response regulator [candidate division KSB1 bacterium]MDZ7392644.1 response regulator [candidate division KSB1 bacterium]